MPPSLRVSLFVCAIVAGVGSPVDAQELTPCPTGYSSQRTVIATVDILSDTSPRITCTAGRFPDPAWVFAVDATDSATHYSQLTILTPSTEPRVIAQSDRVLRFDTRRRTQRLVLADMDGDGTDELFWSGAGCDEGRCHSWLRVMVFSGETLVEAGHFITENIFGEAKEQPTDETICRAVLGLVNQTDGSRLLVADGQESLPDESVQTLTPACLIGPHVWHLEETALEEQPVDTELVGVVTWLVERLLHASQGNPETVRLPWSTQTPTVVGLVALTLEVSETTLLAPYVWLIDVDELVEETPFWGTGDFLPNRLGAETFFDSDVSFAITDTRSVRDRDRLTPVMILPSELACQEVEPLLDARLWLVITDSLPLTDEDFMTDADQRVEELLASGFTGAESFDSRRASLLSCCYRTVVAGRFGTREEAIARVAELEALGFDAYVKAGWTYTFSDYPGWEPPTFCAEIAPPEGVHLPDITEISAHLQANASGEAEVPSNSADDAFCQASLTELFSDGRPVGATPLREPTGISIGTEMVTELSTDVLDHSPRFEHIAAYQIAHAPVCVASLAFEVEQPLPPDEDSEDPSIRWHTRWLLVVPMAADDSETLAPEEASWILWESKVATDDGEEIEIVCEAGRWLESFDDAFLTAAQTRSQFYRWSIDEGYVDTDNFSNLEEALSLGCQSGMYDRVYDYGATDITSVMLFDDRGRLVASQEICEEYQEGGAQEECDVVLGVVHDFGRSGASLFIDRTLEGGAEWYSGEDRNLLLWAFEPDGTLVRAFEGVLKRETTDHYDEEYHLETWTHEFQPSTADRPDSIILTSGEDDDVTQTYEADETGVFHLVVPSAP